jgi:segregation and condensation protein B
MMEENRPSVLPELKEILGAMIFGAERPISLNEMRRCLKEVAEKSGDATSVFGDVRKKELDAALEALTSDIERAHLGFRLGQVAGGYRLHSTGACGVWLKHLLKMEKPARLSRPALETLAIVAYRQPVTKAQIEAVRGVSVDHLIKTLMELQLVRIVGRSELPGRPFLYGTTQLFLEHFGLNSLDALSDIEPMLLLQKGREKAVKQTEKVVADAEEEDSQQAVLPLEGDPSELQEDGAEAAEADVEPRQADAEGNPVNDEDEAVFEDDDEDDDSDEDETV